MNTLHPIFQMARNHLKRFADLGNLLNVFQGVEKARNFNAEDFFGNSNPITLELACGKGEYTVELAKRFPNRNFIGVERKGNRLWKGAKAAIDLGLKNTAFFRMDVELLADVLKQGSIDEIWITFPDPFPSPRRAKKRLTSPFYLNIYRQILKSNGLIHLKTDNDTLIKSTLKSIEDEKMKIIKQIDRLYSEPNLDENLNIKTCFERKFLKSRIEIKYLCILPPIVKTDF